VLGEKRLKLDLSHPADLTVEEVADRMADAVTYLSRVADDAGLDSISADLMSIKKRLASFARNGGGATNRRQ
jgi:hypothetical protein